MRNANGSPIFIEKWLYAVLIGVAFTFFSVFCFVRAIISGGIIFLLYAVIHITWFILLVPHSFRFDDEKITLIFVFKIKTLKYSDIKSCDKEECGIKTYPWGMQYYIITKDPSAREIKIPSTKQIDLNMEKYIYRHK